MSAGERLVLGTWGIAGSVHGPDGPLGHAEVGRATALRVLDAAWAAGIRTVDTAPAYGDGEGYRRLRMWCERNSERELAIVTKIGRPLRRGRPTSALDGASLLGEIQAAVDQIGAPRVVLVKDPPLSWLSTPGTLSRAFATIAAAVPEAGVGLATHLPEAADVLPPAATLGRPCVLQLDYNAVNWPRSAPAARKAHQLGWRVWAMQPLAYGFLGTRTAASSFVADDWRSRMSAGERAVLAAAAAAFRAALPVPLRDVPVPSAIAWCLSDPFVERVVVGPKTVAQLGDALAALEIAGDSTFTEFAQRLRAPLGVPGAAGGDVP